MKIKNVFAIITAMLLVMGMVACTSDEPKQTESTDLPTTTTEATQQHTHAPGAEWKTDDECHWQVCSCGEVMNKAAHSGGTATAEQKAVCETCGAEYGEADNKFDDSNVGEWN